VYKGVKKRCNHCKESLPIQQDGIFNFSRRSASADGFTYTCKICEREIALASYHRRKNYNKARQPEKVVDPQNHREGQPVRLEENAVSLEALELHKQYLQSLGSDKPSAYINLLDRDSQWYFISGIENKVATCQLCKELILDSHQVCVGERVGKDRIILDIFDNKMIICKQCHKILKKGEPDARKNSSTRNRTDGGRKPRSRTDGGRKPRSKTSGDQVDENK
jgi:hypothetical protein